MKLCGGLLTLGALPKAIASARVCHDTWEPCRIFQQPPGMRRQPPGPGRQPPSLGTKKKKRRVLGRLANDASQGVGTWSRIAHGVPRKPSPGPNQA